MRKLFACATLAALAAVSLAAGFKDDEKLDKKVLEIVKKAGDLLKEAKSYHVEFTVAASINGAETKTTGSVDMERPNLLAIRSRHADDKSTGMDIVSDGKHLVTYDVKSNKYTEGEAPADLLSMGQTLLPLGQPNTSMLFQNVLHENPYEQLMEGVTECSYAGKEKVDGVEAHHMKFKQDGFDWEMWVAAEGKPFVVKMASNFQNGGSFVDVYRNWKLDDKPAKDVFKFTPAKDAEKVDSLAGQ